MKFLAFLFGQGCSHQFSWPRVGQDGCHYQVCSKCGAAYELTGNDANGTLLKTTHDAVTRLANAFVNLSAISTATRQRPQLQDGVDRQSLSSSDEPTVSHQLFYQAAIERQLLPPFTAKFIRRVSCCVNSAVGFSSTNLNTHLVK
jgi:hypothetical protein